jgi:outer membrane protein OmpA-like peptidoglycan-associated protein
VAWRLRVQTASRRRSTLSSRGMSLNNNCEQSYEGGKGTKGETATRNLSVEPFHGTISQGGKDVTFKEQTQFQYRRNAAMFFLLVLTYAVHAGSEDKNPVYSPSVNNESLRGLTTIGSAESMGEGRITFGFLMPGYKQNTGYLNTPNAGAVLFTGTGAFSYGVNSSVDIFASVAGYASSNYTNTDRDAGLGTIRAGAQGSLPFPKSAFVRIGGQVALAGGTSKNQINTYRADGYNYFETRDGWDITGKLMQTVRFGGEDFGVKLHLNEGTAIGIINSDPALLLLSAGLQGNVSFAVLGVEVQSRTRFNNMSFGTDPLWVTPSIHLRTPWNTNVLGGVDISLSKDRSGDNPRALEPYRVFGGLAFSIDVLQGRRNAEFAAKEKAAKEKAEMESKAVESADKIESLAAQAAADSVTLANEKRDARTKMDAMQKDADDAARASEAAAAALAEKATEDSLALIQAASDLAREKEMRSDAEKQLLSTGEMLLDAVYFETGKTNITINSQSYLNVIAKMLLKYPKLRFEVAGHTDNVGAKDFNMNLSRERANAVRFYLNDVAPALHLSARGYGMSRPKTDNTTKEGRQINRRVELRVTNMEALQEYSQL